jgi:hypothetical protein
MGGSARAMRIAFGVLAVASLALLGGFLAWSDSPRARYAGMACQYRAIYEREGPVAAVVLGTSRAQRGIDPAALAAGLGLDPEVDPVASLARGGRGPGQLRQMLEDLDEARGIAGPIVLEYTPEDEAFWREQPLYYQYLPNEGQRLRLAALADDWGGKPREPAYSRLRDALGHLQLRLDAGLEALVAGTWRRTGAGSAGELPAAVDWCLTETAFSQDDRHLRQLDRRERLVEREVGDPSRWRELPAEPSTLDRVNQDLQHDVVADVIAFGRERGVPVVVVAMPGYLAAPLAPEAGAAFEGRFGVPLAQPPPEVAVRFGERGLFQDAFHLNAAGREVFTAWLAERVRAARAGDGDGV